MSKRTIIVVLFAFIIIFGGIHGTIRFFQAQKIQNTATTFLKSISVGETQNTPAAGEVLWKIKTSEDTPKAEVVDIKTNTMQFNKKWARVQAVLELKLTDNNVTVNWYEMDLISNQGEWLVISIREIMPRPAGRSSKYEVGEVTKVFEQYCSELQNNQKGISYLAGPARKAEEQATNQIPFGVIKGVQITPLYGDDRFLIGEVNYKIDEKSLLSLVSFYKTSQGWKIVAVQAL